MASIDQLETAMASLRSNGDELALARQHAESQLEILIAEETLAQEALDAAIKRLRQLQTISKRICTDCWAILPCLGPEVYQKAKDQFNGSCPFSCVNCGASGDSFWSNLSDRSAQQQHEQTKITITFPPTSSLRLLDKSKNARRACRQVVNGKRLSRGKRGGASSSVNDYTPGDSDASISDENTSENEDDNDCTIATALSRKDYLGKVVKQKERAKKRLDKVKLAIEKWTIHKQNQEDELRRIAKAIEKIITEECRILGERLEKLGVSKSRRSRSPTSVVSNSCGICWEPPKEKVVFQCGHQCCVICATEMTNCHMCRKRIKQRIKLFE